jgi:succinyl-CoA synthetase beta subunit
MILLEHDAKALMAEHGIAVPHGVLSRAPGDVPAGCAPPVMVKAQVPAGGRGKAGGIVMAADAGAIAAAVAGMIGASIKGHRVWECRVEEVARGHECYVGLALDPTSGAVDVLLSARGGIDIETGARDHVLTARSAFDPDACIDAALRLAAATPEPLLTAFRDVAPRLVAMFFALDATLAEINPLFVRLDGTAIAGDAKLCIDDNALARQPGLTALIRRRGDAYPEVAVKLESGFDFAILDPQGDVGLVTTGAGLTLQLVDELAARGCRPFNFCDIRTGEFRGDPARLIRVFKAMAAAPAIKSVLINFFAGITNLGEIARLIESALRAVPELTVPITARLIGNGYAEAAALLGAMTPPLVAEPDLERALDSVVAAARTNRA